MSLLSVEFEITASDGRAPTRVWLCDSPNAAPLQPGDRPGDISLVCACGSWVRARLTRVEAAGEENPCRDGHDLVELRGTPCGVQQVPIACRRCGQGWQAVEVHQP